MAKGLAMLQTERSMSWMSPLQERPKPQPEWSGCHLLDCDLQAARWSIIVQDCDSNEKRVGPPTLWCAVRFLPDSFLNSE